MSIRLHNEAYVQEGQRVKVTFEGIATRRAGKWYLRQITDNLWPFAFLPESCTVEGMAELPLPGPESDVERPEGPSAGDEPDQTDGDLPEASQPLQSCWCYHRCDHGDPGV